ncbi:MAG: hypothetical protein C4320_00415 [Armatimonadota bacterium]
MVVIGWLEVGCGPKDVVSARDSADPINFPVTFPAATAEGRTLPSGRPMTVVVLPACDSCRVKTMPSDWKRRLPSANLIVVFSPRDLARKQYLAL